MHTFLYVSIEKMKRYMHGNMEVHILLNLDSSLNSGVIFPVLRSLEFRRQTTPMLV